MNISALSPGEEFMIKGFANAKDGVMKRLHAMGLREGRRGKILLKNGRALLIKLDNFRLIIDEDVASHIEVSNN